MTTATRKLVARLRDFEQRLERLSDADLDRAHRSLCRRFYAEEIRRLRAAIWNRTHKSRLLLKPTEAR